MPTHLNVKSSSGLEQSLPLEGEFRVGRGPHNDLVVPSTEVSWTHAVFRLTGTEVVVEDLGSRNGTFIDGRRIERPEPVADVSVVKIGDLEFRASQVAPDQPAGTLVLEDTELEVRYPLRPPRFVFDSDSPEVFLEIDELDDSVRFQGETLSIPFQGTLAGRKVRIFKEAPKWTPTEWRGNAIPVHLRVALDPPSATLRDLQSGASHTVRAEHRVSLLYFLAHALEEDRANGVTPDRCGWRTDAAVSVGVWGRSGLESSRSRLNTLNHRLRAELTKAGITVDLVEKDAGWARLAPVQVELDE